MLREYLREYLNHAFEREDTPDDISTTASRRGDILQHLEDENMDGRSLRAGRAGLRPEDVLLEAHNFSTRQSNTLPPNRDSQAREIAADWRSSTRGGYLDDIVRAGYPRSRPSQGQAETMLDPEIARELEELERRGSAAQARRRRRRASEAGLDDGLRAETTESGGEDGAILGRRVRRRTGESNLDGSTVAFLDGVQSAIISSDWGAP